MDSLDKAIASVEFSPGDVVAGKYCIELKVNAGAFGTIFKATQFVLSRCVALKVMHSNSLGPENLRRFQREAKAAKNFDHENLVKIYEFGILPDDRPFIAMQFVEGESLTARLKQSGPITAEETKKQ
jgi:serine/threonine-protein kinase